MNAAVAAWVGQVGLWAVLGPREIVIVGFVALMLYGRAGLRHSHHARTVWSWMMPRSMTRPVRQPVRPTPNSRPKSKSFWALQNWGRGERLYWALVLVAIAAVATWIVTRTLIVSEPISAR